MAVQTTVATIVAYKQESPAGTIASNAGAQTLRRIKSDVALSIDQITSSEIRPDYQRGEARNGMRKVGGPISGELSPKTYADFIAASLRRDFSAVTTVTGASVTASATAPQFVRAAGSWLTDGIRIGMLVKPSAGANAGKLFTVIAVTATGLTVAEAVAPHAATTLDIAVPGKVTYVPQTGHQAKSFTIEHWHSAVAVSHRFVGCRVNNIKVDCKPNANANINIDLLGMDRQAGTAQYFSSPAAATTTGAVASPSGVLCVNGVAQAIITGFSVEIDGGMTTGAVVGSNITPDVFVGPVTVKGQISAYFTGGALDDIMTGEVPVSLVLKLDDGQGNAIAMTVPRAKLTGGSLSGDNEIIQQFDFSAAPVPIAGAEQTSFFIHDTAA